MTTSEPAGRRFPIVLTLATGIALAILIGLGVWQLQRLAWKQDLLIRIEALKTAPASPLEAAMAGAAAGKDVEWSRVSADCEGAGRPQGLLYGLDRGQVAWRALAYCRQMQDVVVVVDRGYLQSAAGAMSPGSVDLPPVGRVTGILRKAAPGQTESAPIQGGYRFAARDQAAPARLSRMNAASGAYYLVAEREDPAPAGVTPAPLPVDIPNRHLEYALTWFGLAAALAGVYLALLRRRLKA